MVVRFRRTCATLLPEPLSMNNNYVGMVVLMGVLAALAGCASISVQPGTAWATKQQPLKVYVQGFSTDKGEFNVDRKDAELAEFKADLQRMMTAGITTDLSKRLIPA